MPHFLCFTDLSSTDLSSTGTNPNTSTKEKNSSQTIDSAVPTEAAGKSSQHPTALFVCEENKKASFALQRPFALFYESGHKFQNGDNVPKSAQVPAGGDVNADEVHGQAIDDHQNYDKSDAIPLEAPPAIGREKETMMATASITSCVSNVSPESIPQARETFLFGGFELITNVKTVEVYVSKTSNPEEESYLTTCKGIPMRDLPPLMATPLYIDGTRAEGESTTIENYDVKSSNIKESKESKYALGAIKTEERDTFYKFIFVSPGGPKPVKRVRLKFARSNASCVHANSIIVRTLKVKGRLSDSIPTSNASQNSLPQPSLPIGTAKFNPGILNNESKDNMSSLASMMAMMGGNSMKGMPMAMEVNPQQQQLKQLQMQSSHQQYAQQQQQQNNHQQEKNQAEIVSSIAGLGMFLKSSEERTMKKFETMLTNMEMRITKRLDGLAERLDVIEQSINASNNELGSR